MSECQCRSCPHKAPGLERQLIADHLVHCPVGLSRAAAGAGRPEVDGGRPPGVDVHGVEPTDKVLMMACFAL